MERREERAICEDMKHFYEDERRRAEARIRDELGLNQRQIKNAIYRLFATGRIEADVVLRLDVRDATDLLHHLRAVTAGHRTRCAAATEGIARPPFSDGCPGFRTVGGRSDTGPTVR